MTAQRMIRPATAFAATSGRQKRNKIESPRHERSMPRYRDISGRRFGQLTAVSYRGRRRNVSLWLVRCDCGTEKIVELSALRTQQSCGCLQREEVSQRFSTHGLTRVGQHHPLYSVWNGMIRRCHQHTPASHRYKDRGIVVCDRWRNGADDKAAFECFLEDMGERPSKAHSLDRINNDGPYSPENCRWATQTEQQRNRSSNRTVNFNGRSMTLIEAVELSGLNAHTVSGRLNLGWDEQRALTTPVTRRASRLKRPKIHSETHMKFIRSLPCVICGDTTSTECAHVSYADLRYGKFGRGKGQKEESIWVVPMCGRHHRAQHDVGERKFWNDHHIDPCRIAACLFIRTQDHQAAQLILDRARD